MYMMQMKRHVRENSVSYIVSFIRTFAHMTCTCAADSAEGEQIVEEDDSLSDIESSGTEEDFETQRIRKNLEEVEDIEKYQKRCAD